MNLIKVEKIKNKLSFLESRIVIKYKKETVISPFVFLWVCMMSCGLFRKELPQIRVNFATSEVLVMDNSFFIDSIALINYKAKEPYFALKALKDETNNISNSLTLKKPNTQYKIYGNFDSACMKDQLEIHIFIKNHKIEDTLFAPIYYRCNSDSIIFTKPIGDI